MGISLDGDLLCTLEEVSSIMYGLYPEVERDLLGPKIEGDGTLPLLRSF